MKGVSPLIATALLLVITVAGAMMLYNYVVSSLSSPQQYASLNIVSAKLVKLDSGSVLSVRVANIGTAPATINEVILIPSSTTSNITKQVAITVEPGVTKTVNVDLDEEAEQTPGTGKYYVILRYDGGETEPYPVTVVG